MILSKVYSNVPEIFPPVYFSKGINVIRGAIHDAAALNRDTHNLGKTTFVQLINFCLLKRASQAQFVQNAQFLEQMADVVFFLEIECVENREYITIKRPISHSTKISLKLHSVPNQDYSNLGNAHWNHADIGFDAAKRLLDSYLGWRLPEGISYRQMIPFLIREQNQYSDVIYKSSVAVLGQSELKLLIATIFGFDEKLIKEVKKVSELLTSTKNSISEVEKKLAGYEEENSSQVKIKLVEEQGKLEEVRRQIDEVNLQESDDMVVKELVTEVDDRLHELNESYYRLLSSEKRIVDALNISISSISCEQIVDLYEEVGVIFPDSLKRDLSALIDFNKKIVRERRPILMDELNKVRIRLEDISECRKIWYKKRESAVAYIKETNSFKKLKDLASQLGVLQSAVETLQKRYDVFYEFEQLKNLRIKLQKEQKETIQSVRLMVEVSKEDDGSISSCILNNFANIIRNVLNRDAAIDITVLATGNIDYVPSFRDEIGESTDEGKGNTYAKLMCIAFDMAIVSAHCNDRFPRWLIHDGVFEYMDERKRKALLGEMIEYSQLGIQHIVTMIDSDVPSGEDIATFLGKQCKIVLTLSDADDQGLLFKGVRW